MYRVLALDGGGICGLVTAKLLLRIARDVPNFLDDVDLIAGTSSGGLIALALAHRLDGTRSAAAALEEICEVFEDGERTFGRARFAWAGRRVAHWSSLFVSKYSSRSRQNRLRRFFRGENGRDARLGDFHRNVLIAAFDLDNEEGRNGSDRETRGGDTMERARRSWRPKLFHNLPHAGEPPERWDRNDEEATAWKVAMYTSAAPVFFPSFEGFIDGGVYSNNPSMCALAQALDPRYRPMLRGRRTLEDRNPRLDEIRLLSISAGLSLRLLRSDTRLGALWWVWPAGGNLFKLVTDGTVGIADYQCRQLLRDQYLRVEPTFQDGIEVGLDEMQYIDFIRYFGDNCPIRPEIWKWIEKTWMEEGSRVGAPAPSPVEASEAV